VIVDSHMHTPLCGHAVGEPVDFVKAAAAQGVGLITFTCHVPLVPDEVFGGPGIRMRENQLSEYASMVAEARELGMRLGIRVLRGIEAEIFPEPNAMVRMTSLIEKECFDFVLGSLHHHLVGYREWLDRQGIDNERDIIRLYFEQLVEGVRSGLYDSIAHPDVIRIYGTVDPFPPEDYEPEIIQFLDALVESDHCMEVNTSGLIKGVYEVHPAPVILDWAAERGVKLTMGSDAHAPGQVGQHFSDVRRMLRQKGFEKVHYFKSRTRFEVPLED